MQYPILRQLIEQEGTDFYRITYRWQPKDLIPDPYRRGLLKNAQERFNLLESAEDEFQTLDRAHVYIRLLRQMRLSVRKAQFAWRVDDLEFLNAVSEFFSDYGTVLHNLKIDQARGRLKDQQDNGV